MKLKLNHFFYWSIIIQIISTQGLLTFVIFKFLGNWELKKYVHLVSIILIFFCFFFKSIKKFKITIIDLLFFCFFIVQSIILYTNVNNFESIYLCFRETFLIYFLIFVFNQIQLDEQEWNKILMIIFYLIIINSLFIILTSIIGGKEYVQLLTGKRFWATDLEYKFKISNYYGFYRSPALIGDAASVAYFGLISYVLFDNSKQFRTKKIFCLFPLIFSFVRSAYLVFIIYETLKFISKKSNIKNIVVIGKVLLLLSIPLGFILNKYKLLSTYSINDRFRLWTNNIKVDFNFYYGGAIGKIGAAVRGRGFIAILDSYWLYLLMSFGIIGITILTLFVYEKTQNKKKMYYVLIGFILAGFFVNLTQSIVLLALFPLLFLKLKKTVV